jgi:hypothetical protein
LPDPLSARRGPPLPRACGSPTRCRPGRALPGPGCRARCRCPACRGYRDVAEGLAAKFHGARASSRRRLKHYWRGARIRNRPTSQVSRC